MSAPTCPDHGTEMRAGNKGGWYCPRRTDDGEYCKQRVSATRSATGTSTPSASTPSAPNPKQLLVIAALDFASRVFQGTAQSDDALELADAVVAKFGGK